MTYATEQEAFWAGDFGTEYISRNTADVGVAHNVSLFSESLRRGDSVGSVLELGCNVGLNLSALRILFPSATLTGVEINPEAARLARGRLADADIHEGSLLTFQAEAVFDLVLIKGVLIHVAPNQLSDAYDAIHRHAARWILVCEYYNPQPVEVPYRGHSGRLFKRDFAGELLDRFSDLSLHDYGFRYKRDPVAPADDLTWFLLRRNPVPGSP